MFANFLRLHRHGPPAILYANYNDMFCNPLPSFPSPSQSTNATTCAVSHHQTSLKVKNEGFEYFHSRQSLAFTTFTTKNKVFVTFATIKVKVGESTR